MAYKKSPPGDRRRKFKKFVKGAGQVAYKTVKTGANLASLARDVKMLQLATQGIKLGLNVEKKYVDRDVFTGTFGQTNANANGIFMVDITPNMTQGLGSANRIGNSIKLTGISLPVQFSGEASTISARKIKMMLFRVSSADNGVSLTEAIEDYYDPNILNGIIDMNSPRAYRSHKHDGIKLIRSKTYRLPAVPTTLVGGDDNADDVEESGFSTKFNVKLNDVLRFNSNGDSLPDGTRYYLYFFADKGNCSFSTNTTTLDVPVLTNRSGVRVRCGQRSWYVDN